MSGHISKRICCTCLCEGRKLVQLCRLPDGVNLLYMLLMCDTDAYREGFYKDTASWMVCWECRAIIRRIRQFRLQTCTALKQFNDITNGWNKGIELLSLSNLSTYRNSDIIINSDSFIDCGLDDNLVKNESENTQNYQENEDAYGYETELDNTSIDLPNMVQITENEHGNSNKGRIKDFRTDSEIGKDDNHSDFTNSNLEQTKTENVKLIINSNSMQKSKMEHENSKTNEGRIKKSVILVSENENNYKHSDSNLNLDQKKGRNLKIDKLEKFYTINVLNGEEYERITERKKLELNNSIKCESCVVGFKNESELNCHNLELHTKKENHSKCAICNTYVEGETLDTHTNNHYSRYVCSLCDVTTYSRELIIEHLTEIHEGIVLKKKRKLKKNLTAGEVIKYPCTECDMTFGNKGAKWKHVQKCHRDGHRCDICEKVFTFKHNLQRHLLTHTGPHPRTECPHCHKQIRTSLLATHVRTHGERARVACVPCGKAFICRATYESHLKYASAHAAQDSLRHACSLCMKKFRSRGELRDHIAYRHEAKATYKCPVCQKCLATRRCVNRHVRRAHEGIKENARDKMCDYCGKAFRDKQSLSEHVSRHTGARPLTCVHCGRAFRQRAALYAHTRRLHPA